jgi:glycosyltransferase involved in cell wall biosynthesis
VGNREERGLYARAIGRRVLDAVLRYRADRRPEVLVRSAGIALALTVALVGALAALRAEPDIVLVMISEGPRLEKIRQMVAQASLRSVLFLSYQDREALAYSLSAGDAHVVTNKEGLGGLRVPGKTYGILAVGRPVLYIGEPCCEVADLVRDHQVGFVIREHDTQHLVRAIRALRDDPALRQGISVRARALFEAQYQAQPNIDLWERILLSVAPLPARPMEDKVPAHAGTV